jgi:hypothetical protein
MVQPTRIVCCAQAMDGPSKEAAAANANTNVLVISFSLSFASRKVAARTRRGGRPARKTLAAGRACASNSTTMKAYEK